jgi:[ribosomal protein S5]-alanine N-acetyltransferase
VEPSTRERLETERMILERVRPEHAEETFALLRDPRIARTLFASGLPPTDAEMADNLANKVEHWERYGFGLWLLRDRQTGAVVGRGGLQHTFVGGCDEVEVGWAITPARWGQGLATELARASIQVAFDDLGLGEIVAFTLPRNAASRRVMEKSGFTFEREINHAGLPHVLYRRARDPSAGPVATLP